MSANAKNPFLGEKEKERESSCVTHNYREQTGLLEGGGGDGLDGWWELRRALVMSSGCFNVSDESLNLLQKPILYCVFTKI